MTPTIAFVGLGRMGLPMATNLLKAGFAVVGCDVDRSKAEALAARGATTAVTPADAARGTDMTVSMIMNDAILQAVAAGPDGVLAGAGPGHVYVDLSTVSPAASAAVRVEAEKHGVAYLCGKVAGSVGLAEEGGSPCSPPATRTLSTAAGPPSPPWRPRSTMSGPATRRRT